MGGEFNPENLKSFDINQDGKKDLNDLILVEERLSKIDNNSKNKYDINQEKQNYIDSFNYSATEISDEERDNLISIFEKKIKENPDNFHLQRALMWIKFPEAARNTQKNNKNFQDKIKKQDDLRRENTKLEQKYENIDKIRKTNSYSDKVRMIDDMFDTEKKFNEDELITLIQNTERLINVEMDKNNYGSSFKKMGEKYHIIMNTHFSKILNFDGTNSEKIDELNKMYEDLNQFKMDEEKIINLLKNEKDNPDFLSILKEKISEENSNIFNEIPNGFTLGVFDEFAGSSEGIDVAMLMSIVREKGFEIFSGLWKNLVSEFSKMGKDLTKIFDGSIYKGARIIGKFLAKVLKKIVIGAVLGPIGNILSSIIGKIKVSGKVANIAVKSAKKAVVKMKKNNGSLENQVKDIKKNMTVKAAKVAVEKTFTGKNIQKNLVKHSKKEINKIVEGNEVDESGESIVKSGLDLK